MSTPQNKNQPLALSIPIVALLALALCLSSCIEPIPTRPDPVPPDVPAAYKYFEAISAIPRCSKKEQAISDYLVHFANSLGLYVSQDDALNVLIKKGATAGRENEEPIILQAHMDMVCEKDEDVEHDFDNDPIIPTITDDGWITASKRTTLGADDGSGVSMIMAVLALGAGDLSHPPIEALLTTDEESGLLGADLFDVTQLSSRRLINLDMMNEKVFVIGSANDLDIPGRLVPITIPTTPLMKARLAEYPHWQYREDSPLRERMVEVFREYYNGEEPTIAGLQRAAVECSIFANKIEDADMVSIGPDIEDLHRTTERMNLASYSRVYGYLLMLLERL